MEAGFDRARTPPWSTLAPRPPCPSAGGTALALGQAALLPSYHPYKYQVELLAPFAEAPELAISFSEPTSGKVASAVLLTPTQPLP